MSNIICILIQKSVFILMYFKIGCRF